ncbi:General transcription factor IIE subunit 1 [Heracleum sosnowskyi]|uniref:General transcription factor IIE subunit 1 n=1 Tax=Heracleum sosnowskyi TaxID=360622 RepID=A0AAD8IE15_9APIA|nr:General transcription factor IIE subunit 1 [Heracleum sosnowskyi]
MDHNSNSISIKVENINNTSIDSFNRLVKLTARAFYDDFTTKGANQPKSGRTDNRGLAVVVLDALTRRQWVREEDLAKNLRMHTKQLRRILRFFEEEKLVTRDHRKETAKGAKIYSAAVAATADGHQTGREGEGKIKLHTHFYCCLDYAQIYDVVRYRMHRMKKKIKDELEDRNTIQEYICPNCKRRYTALDALQLVSFEGEYFHCEHCNGELVVESDKLAAEEMGDGDDNARRRRREKFKDMLQKFEEKLKPLMDQLNRVKDLPVPDFKTLHDWEVQAYAVARSNGDANDNDPSKSSPSYNGTPMPSLGETKVEVNFSDVEKGTNAKYENTSTPTKVLPPWMIKKGMVLNDEQRGEVKQESNMEGASATVGLSDDKKSIDQKDEKSLQDAYLEAYYAALFQRQHEQEESNKRKQEPFNTTDDSTSRQVGMKSKRGNNDDDDVDENVEWEEAPTAGVTLDLNVEVDALVDEEDDIDWEEG